MIGTLDDRDREYYRRRERQEREYAARTGEVTAKRVHGEMAERYSTLLSNMVVSLES